MRILIPVGTRPEIVKLSSIVRELRSGGFDVTVIATGQHTDPAMSDTFFEAFDLVPDVRWTQIAQGFERLGCLLSYAERAVMELAPDVVLVLGDTDTVPAFCLAARRHQCPVIHLEAGLRSFNETSLEEVNRRVAAASSTLHLAPTELAARFLLDEGVAKERIRIVGNPVIDALRLGNVPRVPWKERKGVLFTAHRATNVDNPDNLRAVVEIVIGLATRIGSVTFPVHPRTLARLQATGLMEEISVPGVTVLEPVDYKEMLELISRAQLVVTDSGGLQEEASWFGVPVVVLRRSTPRWEGVMAGTSVLVGLDIDRALHEAVRLCTASAQETTDLTPCPYGDGRTGERVVQLLRDSSTLKVLQISEPNFVDLSAPTTRAEVSSAITRND